MVLFKLLDDDRGWLNNASEMLKSAKYDYVLLWNEDHMNVVPQNSIAIFLGRRPWTNIWNFTWHGGRIALC